VNPVPTPTQQGEATLRAATAQINCAEGTVLAQIDIQENLVTSLDALTAATSIATNGVTYWTKWMAIATIVLACFTAAQVVIAILNFLRPVVK
jgi:hypothetical protein